MACPVDRLEMRAVSPHLHDLLFKWPGHSGGGDGGVLMGNLHLSCTLQLPLWLSVKATQAQQKKQVYICHAQNASFTFRHLDGRRTVFMWSFFLYCHLYVTWLVSMCMTAGAVCKVVCTPHKPEYVSCWPWQWTPNPQTVSSSFAIYIEPRENESHFQNHLNVQ